MKWRIFHTIDEDKSINKTKENENENENEGKKKRRECCEGGALQINTENTSDWNDWIEAKWKKVRVEAEMFFFFSLIYSTDVHIAKQDKT